MLRIRIGRIRMFFGLLDPDPPIIKQNIKENPTVLFLVTFYGTV
jgi:hypothetical protein